MATWMHWSPPSAIDALGITNYYLLDTNESVIAAKAQGTLANIPSSFRTLKFGWKRTPSQATSTPTF